MRPVTLFEALGLEAALVGAFCGLRGWWPEVAGCVVMVIVCSVLAARWETE